MFSRLRAYHKYDQSEPLHRVIEYFVIAVSFWRITLISPVKYRYYQDYNVFIFLCWCPKEGLAMISIAFNSLVSSQSFLVLSFMIAAAQKSGNKFNKRSLSNIIYSVVPLWLRPSLF